MKSSVRTLWKSTVAVLTCGGLLTLTAAPASIGFVSSSGEFRVDGSSVRGNATVFEGTVIETLTARSTVQFGGTQMTLLPGSKAKVFHDHFDIANLHIASTAKETLLQVQATSPAHVLIAATNGTAQIRNSEGVLVANVVPGMALALDTQTGGAAGAVTLRGKLESRNGKFFLTDKTVNMTVEVQGDNLQSYVGKTVELNGSVIPDASVTNGASEVVHATGVKLMAAKAAAAAGSGAGASAGGVSTGTIMAIAGGVAIAGTVGGLAAAGTFNGTSSVSVP